MERARPSAPVAAEAAILNVARASYGRLIAILAARDGDIAASEDALSEAFASALANWPKRGVPDNPDAWLLTAARNTLSNARRHDRVRLTSIDDMLIRLEERTSSPLSGDGVPDRRLALMFVCAHPAIPEDVRTPLMLQTILGLDAARIASAFLVPPATMSQRLVRAKSKIKAAGIGFKLPDTDVLPARLDDVLQAIYAAFGAAWDSPDSAQNDHSSLANEAIFLARVLITLLPDEPEALGLLSLMLYVDARKAARWSANGTFIPLKEQNARLWSRDKIIEAEGHLTRASQIGRFGRFQCEAAIQSVHVQSPVTGRTNWAALKTLYEMLLRQRPSVGAFVSYGAVLLSMDMGDQALSVLESLEHQDIATYQPYWVTLAKVLEAQGHASEAEQARAKAIELTQNAGLRAFLSREETVSKGE